MYSLAFELLSLLQEAILDFKIWIGSPSFCSYTTFFSPPRNLFFTPIVLLFSYSFLRLGKDCLTCLFYIHYWSVTHRWCSVYGVNDEWMPKLLCRYQHLRTFINSFLSQVERVSVESMKEGISEDILILCILLISQWPKWSSTWWYVTTHWPKTYKE
jgi:hypothetical protein